MVVRAALALMRGVLEPYLLAADPALRLLFDQGHPGSCWARHVTYDDVHQGVPPITDLWSRT